MRLAFATASLSSRQTISRDPVKCPSMPMVYIRYSKTARCSKGCNSSVKSLATADEGNGSSLTQSMQRNLRPPVLTVIKCIGLRHFGQIGGGKFYGMAAHR